MSLDTSKIETLTPSQFITFTILNPFNFASYLRSPLLRIAVLDSPTSPPAGNTPSIAGMIVPGHRESDWIFSTESGHFQLIRNLPNISRLILIGNNPQFNSEPNIYIRPPIIDNEKLEEELKPYVIALYPTECFQNGLPREPVFLTFEDDTLYRVTINKSVGPVVGEFLVEDVEVESKSDNNNKDFRRRLRFKRTPNLIQTQIPLIPIIRGGGTLGLELPIRNNLSNLGLDLPSLRKRNEVEFRVDTEVLVQPYLNAMVSGLFLIVSHLDSRIQQGFVPRALCVGVGGGSLLSFLNTQLGFNVVGMEIDEVVVQVARTYFGLNLQSSLRLCIGDGIRMIEDFARRRATGNISMRVSQASKDYLDGKFDVVMVDLDSSDAKSGIYAPPPGIVRRPVFVAARSFLFDHGVFVIKVVTPEDKFRVGVINELKDVFHKVYEIDVGKEGNFVLVATVSPIGSNDNNNALYIKMRYAVSGAYVDSIKEL